MRQKSSIVVTQHFVPRTKMAEQSRYVYVVTETRNTLTPRVGEELDSEGLDALMGMGVDVRILPPKHQRSAR